MNRKTKKVYNNYLIDIISLFILALVPRFILLISRLLLPGPLPQAYDTRGFLNQADMLINKGTIDMDFNGIFYVSFYSVLGVFQKIIGSTDAFVVFQMIINALTVILIYKLGLEILDRKAAIISGILYAFLYPLIKWSMYITTDSLFITLLVIQAYYAVCCIKYGRRSTWIKLLIVSIYMVFFRPTGIITLTFTAIYLLMNLDLKGFIMRHRNILLIAAGVLAAAIIFSVKKILGHPLTGSLERNMYWLLTEVYSGGQMYDIKTPYDYNFEAIIPPGEDYKFAVLYFRYNFLNIMYLYILRIVAFAGVWIWKLNDMPLMKSVAYLTFYGTTFMFLIAGITDMFRKGLMKTGSIVLFMIGSIMIFTTFFFMDSAYRYRVPALVFGIYLIAQGISLVLGWFRHQTLHRVKSGI